MIIILDNIRSALNVGSILRTCDAFGIKEVYFCGITPEKDNPKVKKTALGAESAVNDQYFPNTKQAADKLKTKGFQIVSLEISDTAKNISDFKAQEHFALVVGNEVSGVSEEVLKMSDAIVKIPMQGKKESLNVAVSFGIAVYALSR